MIDYMIINTICKEKVRDFRIDNSVESDHMTFLVNIKERRKETSRRSSVSSKKIIDWSEAAIEEYRKSTNEIEDEDPYRETTIEEKSSKR